LVLGLGAKVANLFTFPEDFTNVVWTPPTTTVIANATTAPNGTTTADLMVPEAVSGEFMFIYTYTAATTSKHMMSLYVKANGYSKIMFREAAFTGEYIAFNCSGAGSVIENSGFSNQGITSIANGWYRIYGATDLSSGSAHPLTIKNLPDTYTTGIGPTWTPNGTSGTYFWGALLEVGTTLNDYFTSNNATTAWIKA